MKSNLNNLSIQKEVNRMSRIMAAARNDVLVVGADTQLTNSYNHTKQFDSKKIFYDKNKVHPEVEAWDYVNGLYFGYYK